MNNSSIKVSHLSKIYKLYDRPIERLKEALNPFGKKYHKVFNALKDINFEIKKGETIGIVGKNGAGKSTLLKIITKVLTPTTGHIHISGKVASLLELGAGFNPDYTGIENIYLQGTLMGFTKDEMDNKLNDILSFAEIGDFVYQCVKSYSSGMYARLGFAIAINVKPDILIVDETLSVGDIHFVQKCMKKIEEIKKKGTTILFVSHDATAIRTLCDRAIWIHDGTLKEIGSTTEVVDNYLAYMSNDKIIPEKKNNRYESSRDNVKNNNLNLEKRMGTLDCEILDFEILDENGNRTFSVNNDSFIILKVKYINHNLEKGVALTLGYSFRNHLGIDISSSNNLMEKQEILSPNKGEIKTIDIKVELPQIYPDKYTINLSLSNNMDDGSINTLEVIYAIATLEVLSKKQINVFLSFRTTFTQYENN